VFIGGNIRLVKQGAGTFVAAKANQTYSGGTRVSAGTIKPIPQNIDLLFGANGLDIAVDSGAAFDINGNSRCSLYHYVMNGGTAMNGGNALNGSYAQLGDMTLTADSYVDSVGFLKSGVAPLTIDLGGKVLQVTPNKPTYFKKADITNGTLRILRGIGNNNAVYLHSLNAQTATLELESHTGLYDDSVSVSNLILRSGFTTHGGANANHGCRVYGTFKTETGNFPFVRLMDGSTFDLKAWNGVFNTASTSTHQSGFKLIYDEGATVTIDVSGRSLNVGDCIMSWTEIPQNVTFQFDAATAEGGVQPVVTERGLLYGYNADVVEQAWWTGTASDGNPASPQNWLCKNAAGDTVTGAAALPSAVTHVYLGGSLGAIDASADVACRICTITNATLAGDCDLRGFGTNLQVVANAVIDLNGHKLYARAAAFTDVCTVKGKAIDHADDLTTTDASSVTSLPFNGGNTPASNLFNNNYSRGDNTKRVLVPKADWPLIVMYDFGEGKVVDAYRMWVGSLNEIQRMPKRWRFEGANDVNGIWTLLDSRNAEAEWPAGAVANRTYIFPNQTAYRYYRITVEDNCGGADQYGTFLELVQLEYFHLKPTQGELHLSTVSGESTQLYNMSLAGNLRFFIEGVGLLWLGMEGQTYIGGTEICGGMVSGGAGMDSLLNKDVFGVKGSEVVIHGDNTGTASATSGLLGLVGRYGYTGYKYVLDGGNIRDPGDGIVTELLLTTNSYMEASSSLPAYGTAWFGWGGDKHAAYADLGGHELSVKIAGTKNITFANVTLENGSVYTGTQNGTFTVTNSVVATNNVLFRLNSNANNIAGTFSVRDYTQIRSFMDYNLGSHDVDVLGTFTPSAQGFFHGTTLHDGSTIDLSELGIATLNVVAPYSASSTAQGAKTLHFAQGATIGVKLGGRKISRNTPVISWTAATAPDDSVKFLRADEGRRLTFIKKDDGLYVLSGFMIIVK
jgi:autotransporter-associated beta strand protein